MEVRGAEGVPNPLETLVETAFDERRNVAGSSLSPYGFRARRPDVFPSKSHLIAALALNGGSSEAERCCD